MSITKKCIQVFQRAIEDYHLIDSVEQELNNPYKKEDIFISKLESGYEIKAIGSKKIYVNSVPINLPLKQYSKALM